jgi:hypothetical protein
MSFLAGAVRKSIWMESNTPPRPLPPAHGGGNERQGSGSWPKRNPTNAHIQVASARCRRGASSKLVCSVTYSLDATWRVAADVAPPCSPGLLLVPCGLPRFGALLAAGWAEMFGSPHLGAGKHLQTRKFLPPKERADFGIF